MNGKEFLGKFKSSFLWANLLAMALVVVLCVMGVKYGLDTYTHHGEAISVPDVRRRTFDDAERILNSLGFNVVVVDTGYVKTLPADAVLELSPEVGQKVKTGRTIYLTINAADTPVLTMPDVIDNCSYREAQAKLTAMGFLVGDPKYITGEKDWVYGIQYRGRSLMSGESIPRESELTLVIGNGATGEEREMEEVTGEEDEFSAGDIDDFLEVTD